ncbi:hypothetical protein GGH94_001680 [Coemansia aciculifera]|uniref:snRNA-activating protein complex subunit 3 n=1 Tax=Coemansia aciculifera TaxID=417176 RepID=A0A9W8M663_9FUNG|nr:hypothetical protein GGH94_001680 [Coemansia aciculifera]KAJ2875699.1 hypothetical protein GGH93_001369 [Coemansia aciculifera]
MPPSDLISVRNFRDKFAGLVRSQKDRGLLSAQSEWPEEVQQEVASRCQIADDLSFSNAAFVNPTLFHMLRQHREFNDETEREWLQKKRDLAVEQDQQRQEKLDEIQNAYTALLENQQEQQAEEVDEEGPAPVLDTPARNGQRGRQDNAGAAAASGDKDDAPLDTNMLLSVEVPEGDTEIDMDAFQNTAVGPGSGDEPLSNGILSGDSEMPAQAENGKASAGESDDGLSIDGLSDDLSSDEDDNYSPSGSKITSNAAKAPARQPADVAIRTPQSALPQGITHEMLRKALANSGFVRSTEAEEDPKRVVKQRTRVVEPAGVSELESKFRTVKTSLDESTLASLREANRRMVPARYRLEVNFMSNRVQPEEQVPNSTPVADDEVILSVCFYNTRSSNAKMEEYLVLGSQSLTVLRDAFYCISDFLISHRDEVTENSKERKTSSSYFFIEKTFYNDMRSPTATDYSRVITEWANDPERQEKNPKLRGLQSRLMDGARFLDLSIRLKQPYIFMHQGDCEHVLMFTDLRLLGPKDDQFVESYPKQIFRTRHMRHKCRMCSAYPAQFVTKNDFHSGMSPCYFCEKCYTPFHFGADDEKLLDHDVFPYANVNYM